jgi:hypothetical protein
LRGFWDFADFAGLRVAADEGLRVFAAVRAFVVAFAGAAGLTLFSGGIGSNPDALTTL